MSAPAKVALLDRAAGGVAYFRSRLLPPLTEDLWSSSFFGIVIRSPEPLHEDHEPLRVLLALLLLRALDHLPHQIPCLPLHFYSVAPLWVVEL